MIGLPVSLAIVHHSNAPHANTGYGQQTTQLMRRMMADGHQVAIVANYGLEATTMEWEGARVYPRGYDIWNNDMVEPTYLEWSAANPDRKTIITTLFDVWVYDAPAFDKFPTASWVPIDHMPAPEKVLQFLRKPTVTPIAMSQFGAEQLRRAGVDCEYAPHAIETKVFKPTARVDISGKRMTGREMMGLDEDRYVVGIFAANKGMNPSRKAWPEMMLAFALFASRHDDAVLYCHTNKDGMGGLDLQALANAVGLASHQIRFVNQWAYRMGIPSDGLAALMSATDVGLLTSMGEGFGIPAIELQACGTPVILNNFSAQPELLGDGWLTDGQPYWDGAQLCWMNTPFVGSIVDALEAAYQRGRGRSAKAEQFVREHYGADVVFEDHWRPILDRLESA